MHYHENQNKEATTAGQSGAPYGPEQSNSAYNPSGKCSWKEKKGVLYGLVKRVKTFETYN